MIFLSNACQIAIFQKPSEAPKGSIIESSDSNIIRPGALAKRLVHFPEAAARRNSGKRERKRASARRTVAPPAEGEAFGVKVKRRLGDAGRVFLMGLGLYGQIEEMPLGLVVDVWV